MKKIYFLFGLFFLFLFMPVRATGIERGGRNSGATVTESKDVVNIVVSAGSVYEHRRVISASKIVVTAGSGSVVNLDVQCGELLLDLKSGSMATIKGECDIFKPKVGSGSFVSAQQLDCRVVDFNFRSGSVGEFNVSEKITGSAGGGSSIIYRGQGTQHEVKMKRGSSITPG